MKEKKKTIAAAISVAADMKQSPVSTTKDIISRISGEINEPAMIHRLDTITMPELYEKTFQTRPPVIDGLLYPGTYLFCGPPKLGKSFMMMQIAYHVAAGIDLWGYKVHKGAVLYMALEDDEYRLQRRLYMMFDTECAENLYMTTRSDTLSGNLIDQIHRFAEDHPETTLIIIDTLQKIREGCDDRMSYANDYEVITGIKQFTDNTGICLLLVHHTRKQQSEDIFERVSGTNGLLGAADGCFLLDKKKRTSCEGTLDITGRDQPDQTLYLNRDPNRLVWVLDRAETERFQEREDPILDMVSTFVIERGGCWNGTATELAEQLGADMNAIILSKKLNINTSKLKNDFRISYENTRTHDGRRICLSSINDEA